MIDWLKSIETLLENFFERSGMGVRSRVAPLDLVRQIQKEIDRNKQPFINDQILVPHRLVIHLFAPTQQAVDEYEAIFNTAELREFIEKYIGGRGYKLRDRLRVSLVCHQDRIPEFARSGCFLEFSWPQGSTDPDDLTVTVQGLYAGGEMNTEQSGFPCRARVEVVSGVVYESPVEIRTREFNLGRTQNIVQEGSGKVIRINQFAFARPEPGDLVNRSVSRRHATIAWDGSRFLVHDCGSENGTRIERGRSILPVPKGDPRGEGVPLLPGDIIELGQARIRFQQDGAISAT
jgi:hypothetical protein